MKTLFRYALGILVVATVNIACTKNNSTGPGPVTPVITTGDWVVSLFSEPGENKTSNFSGYSFTFQSGGKLIAIIGGVSKEGTWSENASSHKLIIDLGPKDNSNKPLGELTDDWVVTAKSDTHISLKDDNTAKNEVLEFSKK